MRTLLFTGNGGSGSAIAAAATAGLLARNGRRTLLASIGPSHGLAALIGGRLPGTPQNVGPNLDAWTIDLSTEVNALWEQLKAQLATAMGPAARLSGDELPLAPGIDQAIGFYRLSEVRSGYDLLVVDAGPHDNLLRTFALPDSARWGYRLAMGFNPGGWNSDSLNWSLFGPGAPTGFAPLDLFNQAQEWRVRIESMRDELTDPARTNLRYVLRPDPPALEEALLAVPALQLHGLAVDGLVIGPLLPEDIGDARLQRSVEQQAAVKAAAARTWAPRPLLELPLTEFGGGVAALCDLGEALYGERSASDALAAIMPIEMGDDGGPFLAINLAGAPRETLGLTLSGEELIVRVGPYRRHVPLPAALRGSPHIKASREGERLVVRLRAA